ncbi:MAG: hypothetical protein Q9188_001567 [Gyalolechia gomerana]
MPEQSPIREIITKKPLMKYGINMVGEGDKSATWTLPKELLTNASPFFNAALNGTWLESEAKQVELKDDDPNAFRFFIHWLYEWTFQEDGKYPSRVAGDLLGTTNLDAWVLGDKLGCPRFQDFALAHLQRSLSQKADKTEWVRRAYANSPAGSKLRHFMACIIIYWITDPRCCSINNDQWTKVLHDVEDLSSDIVLLQMRNAKPFKYADIWPSCFIVSSKDDFQFDQHT